ncbi:MAG: lipopolysaccharide transport periplasmic protein LptA [Gammaproteobacteria bacterium]|nr:lipopolysaccharide transport periplasmic protein LptA [Gammaproteobacteria bacterium]MBU1601127.1 lipopolysaccharide transport periplasmic protein LptA [Gammaproteobacteria bacterium]MBU2434486.1 lipopolysaccharide transport periplasmic protein LptA [Gammaproteobacteria bacterium]MBU2450890.1 lipopolysaccharide transport periplasmic protein LptA [Gammaproteobacteria bacterium]
MTIRLATLTLCLLISIPAHAERADRDKPMLLEANRVSIDDARKIQILEGDVLITKGTMTLKADRVVIREDQFGFQKGTAFGGKSGLARFRQKRDGKEEYVEGEGERIEYNTNSEILELFHRAWVRNGEDQVRGDYIWYDAISEKYLVTAGETRDPKTGPGRVRVVIQPKGKDSEPAPATRGERLELKGSGDLGTQNAQ